VALAVLEFRENGKPARSCEVDCLSDVKAEVESLVVGR